MSTEILNIAPRPISSTRIDPRPWSAIEDHYVSLNSSFDQQEMVELIQHIRSAYALNRLHAITSMHTLIISQSNPIFLNEDVLRVDFDYQDRNFFSISFKKWQRRI